MSFYEPSEHGGVTDEMLDKFFADNPDYVSLGNRTPTTTTDFFSSDTGDGEPTPPPAEEEPEAPDGAPAEPPTEPPVPEPEPEPEPEAEPPAPDDNFIEIDGISYPKSQVAAATRFQQQLAQDVRLQQLIQSHLTGAPVAEGGAPASPAGVGSAPAGPPEELDLEDPSIKALYSIVQTQNEQLAQLRQSQQASIEAQLTSQRTQINGLWNEASESFRKDHDLAAEDIETLSGVAARLNVLPSLMQGMDPLTGAPTSPDPIKAFDRALEIAMFMVPEYRERELRRTVADMKKDAERKKNLSAVGGSSGSVKRTTAPPKPGTREANQAMLQEVGAMLHGEWSDPTAN